MSLAFILTEETHKCTINFHVSIKVVDTTNCYKAESRTYSSHGLSAGCGSGSWLFVFSSVMQCAGLHHVTQLGTPSHVVHQSPNLLQHPCHITSTKLHHQPYKNVPHYSGQQLPCFLVDIYISCINGKRNKYPIENLQNLQLYLNCV